MKIVNITASFLAGDGIGNACRARARGLVNAGHSVVVLTPCADAPPLEHPDLECIVTPWTWLKPIPPLTADGMQRLQTAELIVVDFGGYSPLHAWLRHAACPLLVTYHGLTPGELIQDSVYKSNYLRSVADLRQLPHPDMVVGDSATILREYELLTGQTTSQRKVIQLFGHTLVSAASSTALDASAVEDRATDGRLNLLCVGRIYPNKNLELAIQAVRLLRQRQIDVRLKIVGGGSDTVARRYRQRLAALAEGLEGRIEFLGRVSAEDLDRCYAECSAVVIPSLHEGFSLPAVEALMHGKPVFASRLGALPETLGAAAVLFDPFDTGSLVRELMELIRPGSELGRALNRKAVHRASELSEERFVEAYRQVVAGMQVVSLTLEKATEVAARVAASAGDPPSMMLTEHVLLGTRLSGMLVATNAPEDLAVHFTLRAVVLHEGLVSLVAPPLSAEWIRVGEAWVIQFSVQLVDAGEWTELVLMLYREDQQVTCSEINPCWLHSPSFGQSPRIRATPLSSLPLLARQTFSNREIEGSKGFGWAYRFKASIANPFLSLVHNFLISPQVLIWDSLLQQLHLRTSARPAAGDRSDSSQERV